MIYCELLEFCKERFDTFFKNVPIFENQFTFNDYNLALYTKMYGENSYNNLQTVKELKEQVPELKDLCKKCGNFYIPARNKSIPKYDVILGMQHEEIFMDFLEHKLGAKTCRADLKDKSLPDCQILKQDGSVGAYFEIKFHGAPFVSALKCIGRHCYEGSATLDYKKIEKQLALVKELDAPTFYVHWIEYPCLKGIFFETAEQVENYIKGQHAVFEREKREGDNQKSSKSVYLKKMYSPLLQMGSFETLLEILRSLVGE